MKFNVTILHKNFIDTVLKSQYVFCHFEFTHGAMLSWFKTKMCTFLPYNSFGEFLLMTG